MKVVSDTDEVLLVENRPWRIAALLAGLGGLTAGLAFLVGEPGPGQGVAVLTGLSLITVAWWAFPFSRTVFHRGEGLVVHEERRVTGTHLITRPLAEVERARVQASWADDSRSTRLVLATTQGPLPLERSYGQTSRRAAEAAINDWLTRPV